MRGAPVLEPEEFGDLSGLSGLRARLRSAGDALAQAQFHSEQLQHQRDAARVDAQRWELQYLALRDSHNLLAARRDALVAALPSAMSAMLTHACAAAWEEGWHAAQGGMVVLSQNPYRAAAGPVPGSPAATLSRCRAYLRYVAQRRHATTQPARAGQGPVKVISP